MNLFRFRACAAAGLVVLLAQAATGQEWSIINDQVEDFTLYLKPSHDPAARRIPHQLKQGEATPIQYAPDTRYLLTFRADGGRTYRLSSAVSLDARAPTELSRIVSPVKNRNGRIKKDDEGRIVYQVMNQDGFEQDEDYEDFINTLMHSSWVTQYEIVDSRETVNSQLSFDGMKGTYGGRNGRLANVAYSANQDEETIIIDGDWNWRNGGGKGGFYFIIHYNQPDSFSGEYWRENESARYSWSGTRARSP